MSYSLLLLLPSLVVSTLRFPSALPLLSRASLSSPRATITPLLATPLVLSVVAVFDRNSISTGPPLSPTFSPLLRDLRLLLLLLFLFYISCNHSSTPLPFGRSSAPGKGSHRLHSAR